MRKHYPAHFMKLAINTKTLQSTRKEPQSESFLNSCKNTKSNTSKSYPGTRKIMHRDQGHFISGMESWFGIRKST